MGFSPLIFVRGTFRKSAYQRFFFDYSHVMWKSFENVGLQTSEKVSWEKRKKHAQNIRSTVHRTGDLIRRHAQIIRTGDLINQKVEVVSIC